MEETNIMQTERGMRQESQRRMVSQDALEGTRDRVIETNRHAEDVVEEEMDFESSKRKPRSKKC